MDGLAASMVQPQQAPAQSMAEMPSVDEIIALLMQGIAPEDLESQGIPPELIMEAITMLEQKMAAEQQAPQQQAGGGLAQHMVGQ